MIKVGANGYSGKQFGDTTKTKIFVGGLPWETRVDTMRRYFEQFGEILEAVVITDKFTARSKGYGFVSLLLGLLCYCFRLKFYRYISIQIERHAQRIYVLSTPVISF